VQADKQPIREAVVYSTYEVHVIKHFDDTEVIDGLPLEQASTVAADNDGVVVERVHYNLEPAEHR
jgi:hypothetical protein